MRRPTHVLRQARAPRSHVLLAAALLVSLVSPVTPAVAAQAPPSGVSPASPARSAAVTAEERGPALRTPRRDLDRAVRCTARVNRHNARRTVVLVHGTAATPQEAWSWGYLRALSAEGFGVCTVRLPGRALVDVTVSSEYAVHAARVAHRRSGRDVTLVGHSQGGAIVAWAATFWPDVARHTADVVSLAGPLSGTQVADVLCVTGRCATVAWQQRPGSDFIRALRSAPRQRGPAVTSIATRYDELVAPQPRASRLRGARTILVQQVCPLRVVEHGLLLGDPVGYALVRDAMRHPGPARVDRIDRSVCRQTLVPNADPVGAAAFAGTLVAFGPGLLDPRRWVGAEPRLPAYAQRHLG